jgi:rhodanese-related sulfurtransferase
MSSRNSAIFRIIMTLEILLLLILVLVLMSLPIVMRRRHGKVRQVTPLELEKRMGKSPAPRVIDIRPAKSYGGGHLAGSENLPLAELVDRLQQEGGNKSQELILVCQSDMQSTGAAAKLGKLGWQNVAVLKGGFFGWKRARLPLERSRPD